MSFSGHERLDPWRRTETNPSVGIQTFRGVFGDRGGLDASVNSFVIMNQDLIEETTMGRFTVAAAALVALLAAPCFCNAGLITYSIQNYPADQNGANVSGTITTDGTIGNLSAGDILSWSWTITPAGGTAFTFSSTEGTSRLYVSGSVVASPSEITIAEPSLGYENAFEFMAYGGGADYYRNDFTDFYSAENVWFTYNPSMGGTDPWVIAVASAAVPEPSSLTLAGLAVLSGLAHGLARTRKAGGKVVTT